MAKPKEDTDTRTQRQKFIDLARERGANGDADAFRRAVRSVAVRVTKTKKAITRKRK